MGNRLYVLGGASEGRGHNDLHVLDPATQVWSRPVMCGQPVDTAAALASGSTTRATLVTAMGQGAPAPLDRRPQPLRSQPPALQWPARD